MGKLGRPPLTAEEVQLSLHNRVEQYLTGGYKDDVHWGWRGPVRIKRNPYSEPVLTTGNSKTGNFAYHRVVDILWEVMHGPIQPGHTVVRTCERRYCLNVMDHCKMLSDLEAIHHNHLHEFADTKKKEN